MCWLTGGIGSGKTVASDQFASFGISIVDADLASRVVVEPGKPALEKIAEYFGETILNQDGSLNRAELRKKVFSHIDSKNWLEALLHPLIREEIIRQRESASSEYVILVSPLLIESGQYQTVDRVLVVDTSTDIQLERTIARDNTNSNEVEAIISQQISREERLKYADDILINDKHIEHVHQQVEQLHKHYLELARKP